MAFRKLKRPDHFPILAENKRKHPLSFYVRCMQVQTINLTLSIYIHCKSIPSNALYLLFGKEKLSWNEILFVQTWAAHDLKASLTTLMVEIECNLTTQLRTILF